MKYLVIKFGGSILEQLPFSFYNDVISLHHSGKWKPIIVHGGGPIITKYLEDLNIKTTFVNGLRKTTPEVLSVVEMVLSGIVNKQIVVHIQKAGGKGIGLSGIDGELLHAIPLSQTELGFVGEVSKVNTSLLIELTNDYIPVISPIGMDKDGTRYNINGDTAAAAIAKAVGGNLCFVSDIPGIYVNENGNKKIIDVLTGETARQLIRDGHIVGGMIPKVQAALEVLSETGMEVTILSGKQKESLLSWSNGVKNGTLITNEISF